MYGGSQSYIDTLNRLYNVTDDIDMGFRIDKCGGWQCIEVKNLNAKE